MKPAVTAADSAARAATPSKMNDLFVLTKVRLNALVVATTAVCWYVGIVAFNSDYAFTVTNVIIHGVPYFAIVYFYAKARREKASPVYQRLSGNWFVFLATLWALAYAEELVWHRGVWHERNWLFGANWDLGDFKPYLVPLLAIPQLTHYVLDGFIWRKKTNEGRRVID